MCVHVPMPLYTIFSFSSSMKARSFIIGSKKTLDLLILICTEIYHEHSVLQNPVISFNDQAAGISHFLVCLMWDHRHLNFLPHTAHWYKVSSLCTF